MTIGSSTRLSRHTPGRGVSHACLSGSLEATLPSAKIPYGVFTMAFPAASANITTAVTAVHMIPARE